MFKVAFFPHRVSNVLNFLYISNIASVRKPALYYALKEKKASPVQPSTTWGGWENTCIGCCSILINLQQNSGDSNPRFWACWNRFGWWKAEHGQHWLHCFPFGLSACSCLSPPEQWPRDAQALVTAQALEHSVLPLWCSQGIPRSFRSGKIQIYALIQTLK